MLVSEGAATGQILCTGVVTCKLFGWLGCLWPLPPQSSTFFCYPHCFNSGDGHDNCRYGGSCSSSFVFADFVEISIANKMIYVTLASAMAAPLIALGGGIALCAVYTCAGIHSGLYFLACCGD